jgi:hypothetical protein
MTALLSASADLYRELRGHLTGHVEQVGFFLADYDPDRRAFLLRTWRPVPREGFQIQSEYHVTLTDEMRPQIIKWASDAGASLVEAHSHGDTDLACFSPSDLCGLQEWVPHLWWRLRGWPYAAIVTTGEAFDAIAWIDGPDRPEQIHHLQIIGDGVRTATALTLPRLHDLKERRLGAD